MRWRIVPAAREELEEAAKWYDAARGGLAEELLDAFEAGLERIAELPHAWHPLSNRTRQYRLNRFPYGIVYQVRGGEIVVFAVAHLQRRPPYWRSRLKE